MDLLSLLRRPEGKTLEFKRDLSSLRGALKTVVAFANTSGGVLLVGVEDETRHVRGVAEPLDVEERLANLISDHVTPRLLPELEIIPWRGTHVVAVEVFPSPSRPHYLTRDGLDGGVYVRVGSTNRRADPELVEELRRYARGEAYDEAPMPDLDAGASDRPTAAHRGGLHGGVACGRARRAPQQCHRLACRPDLAMAGQPGAPDCFRHDVTPCIRACCCKAVHAKTAAHGSSEPTDQCSPGGTGTRLWPQICVTI